MTKEELLVNLEFWASCLENPTYNSLEVGFRHTPLTKDEIIGRYKIECDFVYNAILRVIDEVNRDGLE